MQQSTFYQKLELGIGLAGLTAGIAALFLSASPAVTVPPERLLKWLGIALLGQGLIRDIVLLLTGSGEKTEGKRKLLICLESTLGAGLIALAYLLAYLEAQQQFALRPGWLILLFASLWLFGFATRDYVLEMRKDPNHINLLVGFPSRNK